MQLTESELQQNRFATNSVARIPLEREDEVADSPLHAVQMKNGHLFASWGEKQAYYCMVSSTGQVIPPQKLDEPVEANPVEIDAGLVLPVADNLILVPPSGRGRLIITPIESRTANGEHY
ncbi:MAG: hypothetical protein R3C11_04125 [Planctomycetaceae bacterium]